MSHDNGRLTKAHAKLLFVAWLWLLLSAVMYYFDLTPWAVAALIMIVVKLPADGDRVREHGPLRAVHRQESAVTVALVMASI